MIKLIDDSLAELQPKRESTNPPSTSAKKPPPQQDQPPAQNKEKWSRDSHPAFKKAPLPAEEKEPEVSVTYRVNDNVMSKWVSGDKGFYPARITSVTGSSTNPIYTVKFKSYDTVETLRAKDIRPMAQKRKADGPTPASSGTNPTSDQSPSALQGLSPSDSPSVGASNLTKSTPALASGAGGNNGVVLTAEASLYPQAQQAGKDGQDAEEKPRKKFKKIKANKELEAGKNRWQEFNNKGKFGKTAKKESMFRTPEGVRGRGMSVLHLPRLS